MPDESQEIPVIDFGPFWSGTRAERQVVAEQMRRASQDWGFFYLSGCGMPTEQLEAAFSGAKAFFDLPLEEKQGVAWFSHTALRFWIKLTRGETKSCVLSGQL